MPDLLDDAMQTFRYSPQDSLAGNADAWISRILTRQEERPQHAAHHARMQQAIEEMEKDKQLAAWRAVPQQVTNVLAKAAAQWPEIHKFNLHPLQTLLWNCKNADLRTRFVRDPADEEEHWIPVKVASGLLEPVANTVTALQKPFGGPNPLTAAITGGLLMGGAGYGAGALLEKFLPKKHFRKGRLKNVLGLAGAATAYGLGGLVGGMAAGKLLGAMAGLNHEGQQQPQQSGMWAGLITGAAKQLLGDS